MKLPCADPPGVERVRGWVKLAASVHRLEVEHEIVILHFSVFHRFDVLELPDEIDHIYIDSALLFHFANDCINERFRAVHRSARKRPGARKGRISPFYEEHAVSSEHHCTHSENRLLRKSSGPHSIRLQYAALRENTAQSPSLPSSLFECKRKQMRFSLDPYMIIFYIMLYYKKRDGRMNYKDHRLLIGGVSAHELVEEFGSPLYVYEEDTIRERASELKRAITFQPKEIKYACKANTNMEIMRILCEEGTGIDAVSPGEIRAALEAGFDPARILFTANNSPWEEIEYAVDRGVMVNIDSLSYLGRFGKACPGGEVCVRINPNVGAGHHNHVITGGPESKFGILYSQVDEIKDLARAHGLKISGIHQHIGSGILSADTFVKAVEVLMDIASKFEDLSFVDFGGGIGVPYREKDERIDIEKLGTLIAEEFSAFCGSYGKKLKLLIEPGRYIVAESGYLLATVTAVKQGEKHRFVGVDTGFNHLLRPAMYGSYHHILHCGKNSGETVPQTIAGYLCESGDTFTRDENGIVDRELPLFEEGDIVCICNAGAYGYSMASQYNSRPRPAEVIVKGNSARCVRRRETLDDIFESSEVERR